MRSGLHRSMRFGGVVCRGVVVEAGDVSGTRAPALASQGSVGLAGWGAMADSLAVLGLAARPDAATLRGLYVTEPRAVQWIERCCFGFGRVADRTSGAAHLCHG